MASHLNLQLVPIIISIYKSVSKPTDYYCTRLFNCSSTQIEGQYDEKFDQYSAILPVRTESQLSNPTEVLPLLQVSELRELRKHLNLPSCGQKAQIIESLFKHDREHKPLFGKSHFLASVVQR